MATPLKPSNKIQVLSRVILFTIPKFREFLEKTANAIIVSVKGIKGSLFWMRPTTTLGSTTSLDTTTTQDTNSKQIGGDNPPTTTQEPIRICTEFLVLKFDKDVNIEEFKKNMENSEYKDSVRKITNTWAEMAAANKIAKAAKAVAQAKAVAKAKAKGKLEALMEAKAEAKAEALEETQALQETQASSPAQALQETQASSPAITNIQADANARIAKAQANAQAAANARVANAKADANARIAKAKAAANARIDNVKATAKKIILGDNSISVPPGVSLNLK